MSVFFIAKDTFTFVADSAVEKGDLVELGTAFPDVKKTAGDTALAIGYAAHDAADNGQVVVHLFGKMCYPRTAGAISAGGKIAPAADGEIQAAIAGDQCIGIALKASTGADEFLPCLITGAGGWLVA